MQPKLVIPFVVAAALLAANTGAAQDKGSVALNLAVVGSASVGLTMPLSPGLAIRPTIIAQRFKNVNGKQTQLGGSLDLLFGRSAERRVAGYWGFGGTVTDLQIEPSFPGAGGTTWNVHALFGVRFRAIDRVSLFGESWVQYARGPRSDLRMWIGTTALGVMVDLRGSP